MGSAYLWLKALHVVFVVSWFAGLFYLPRLFMNVAQVDDATTRARLLLMARKLLAFTSALAVVALVLGVWLLTSGIGRDAGWMQAKLALVLLLIGYHAWCAVLYMRLAAGANPHPSGWYRWFNEVPVLLLFGIVVLVIVKPL